MLIKYYGSTTCYDGRRQFTVPLISDVKRFYPDEYLIDHILRTYVETKEVVLSDVSRVVKILYEPWQHVPLSQGSRTNDGNGAANTVAINDLIVSTVTKLDSNEKQKEVLVLVPFLYGYHHPGIAILVKPGIKKAIYVDPFGGLGYYGYTNHIGEKLQAIGFDFSVIETQQQRHGFDGTSCGPILAASMMEFIDEFIMFGDITGQSFQAPRPNLATDRMKQITINNSALDFSDLDNVRELLVNELMLANAELWEQFLKEQHISRTVGQQIISVIQQQISYVNRLSINWQNETACEEIISICRLQSALINMVIEHSPDEEITAFLSEHHNELPQNEQVIKFNNIYVWANRFSILAAIVSLMIFLAWPELMAIMISAAVLSIIAAGLTVIGPIFGHKHLEIISSVDVEPVTQETLAVQQSCYPICSYAYDLLGLANMPNLELRR
jgi:hypothetical protein